jgi:serine protease Do
MNDDLAAALGLPVNRGEFIQSVQPGEPAEQAGLQAGDVVVTVDGKEVTREQTLSFIVANIEPGRRINLEIIRDGERRTVTATVGRRPSEDDLAAQVFNPDDESPFNPPAQPGGVLPDTLGLQVIPLTPQIASQLGLPPALTGVVIAEVDPNSDAASKGLTRGTVIVRANNQPLTSAADLEAVIAAAKAEGREAVLLRVRARGAPEVTIPVRLR